MKKFLQKTLAQFRVLLLMAVMLGAGSSAWAQQNVTPFPASFNVSDLNGDYSFALSELAGQSLSAGSKTITLKKDGDVVPGSSVSVKSVSGNNITLSVSGVSSAEDGTYVIDVPSQSFTYMMFGVFQQSTASFQLEVNLSAGGGGGSLEPVNAVFEADRNNWTHNFTTTPVNGVSFNGRWSQDSWAVVVNSTSPVTFSVPTGYVITNIVLTAPAGKTVNLTADPAAGTVLSDGNTVLTWTNRANQVTFTNNQSTNQYIQSAVVTYEASSGEDPVYTYDVVYAGDKSALPNNTQITVLSNPYTDGEVVEAPRKLAASDVSASTPAGFETPSVAVAYVDAEERGTITVTYTRTVHNYTVHLTDAPNDAKITVTGAINGTEFGNNATVQSYNVLTNANVTASYDGYDTTISVTENAINVTYNRESPVKADYDFASVEFPSIAFDGTVNSAYGILYIKLYAPEGAEFNSVNQISQINIDGTPVAVTKIYKYTTSIQIALTAAYTTAGTHTVGIPAGIAIINGHSNLAMNAEFTVEALNATLLDDGYYYGTYFTNSKWVVPENCEACAIAAVDSESGVLTVTPFAVAGECVAPNVPTLLKSSVEIANQTLTTNWEEAKSPASNMLEGTIEAKDDINGAGAKYYLLSTKGGKAGFYWDPRTEDEGASLNNGAHKAYLKVPADQASNISGFRFNFGDDDVTAIKVVETEKNDAIYNLQGQRVNATAAGIYVKNGRKFIVK